MEINEELTGNQKRVRCEIANEEKYEQIIDLIKNNIKCPIEKICSGSCNKCIESSIIKRVDSWGEWVPISEREPEEYMVVLVQLETEPLPTYDIALYCEEYGFRPWYSEYFEDCTPEWENRVVAWMRMPSPWKTETN